MKEDVSGGKAKKEKNKHNNTVFAVDEIEKDKKTKNR